MAKQRKTRGNRKTVITTRKIHAEDVLDVKILRKLLEKTDVDTWKGRKRLITLKEFISYTDQQLPRQMRHLFEGLATTPFELFESRLIVFALTMFGRNKWAHDIVVKKKSATTIPKSAEKLLYFILPKSAREHLPGDLEEEYRTKILPKFGPRYAKIWYWKQAVGSIGPILRSQMLKLFGLASVAKVAQWVSQRFGF